MDRDISAELKAHLQGEVTTVCMCWKIVKADSTELGFTSHDVAITYDGLDYEPLTSAAVSSTEQSIGTNVDNMDVEIAFDSSYITKDDLRNGLYDGAKLYVFMINYEDTTMGILKIISGGFGEVRLKEFGGKVEFRSLAQKLQQQIGRLYMYKCNVELGSTKCGIELDDSSDTFTFPGTVTTATDNANFIDSSISEDANYFKYGKVLWVTGDNAGTTMEIKTSGAAGQFELFLPMNENIAVGDDFIAYAGCDKYADTCKDKFDNLVNFRGFPHIPGRDEVLKYPDAK